ncbi:MAG: YkgJ family cysteine cluster protein [Bacillota bacterium]
MGGSKKRGDYLMGQCKKCGLCCKAIAISSGQSEEELINSIISSASLEAGGDAVFIIENWEQITQAEALEINPNLKQRIDWCKSDNIVEVYFKCHRLDPKTNLCIVHDKRPQVCSGYPWYGRMPHKMYFYSPNCGYAFEGYSEEQEQIQEAG